VFGLVETELVPRPSLWERLRLAISRETMVWVEEERVWGVLLTRVRVQLWCDAAEENRRRVEMALQALQDRGIRGVVASRTFAYSDLLPAYGLTTAEPAPLYRRMAARLATLAADQMCVAPVRLRVCFIAKRMTAEVIAAMEQLCVRARYLFLCLERGGGGDVCRKLRRDAGVSVVENPSADQIAGADLYLVFDSWEEERIIPAKQGAAVLLLAGGRFVIPAGCLAADGAELLPPARLRNDWLWDADNEGLLAALTASGAVLPGEVRVRGLKIIRNAGF